MPSRPFGNFEVGSLSAPPFSSALQMSSCAVPMLQARALSDRAADVNAEWPAEAVVDIRLLGRGVAWALTIEATAAAFVCVIWHLCRTLL